MPVVVFHRSQLNRTGLARSTAALRRYGVPRLGPRSTTRDATGRSADRLVSALSQSGTASASLSGFARTSGFENYKVSGFANYSRPVLLAPQQKVQLRLCCAGSHCRMIQFLRVLRDGQRRFWIFAFLNSQASKTIGFGTSAEAGTRMVVVVVWFFPGA